MKLVAESLSSCEVEINSFALVTRNLLDTHPNKIFRATPVRLAILRGPSPELIGHVRSHGAEFPHPKFPTG